MNFYSEKIPFRYKLFSAELKPNKPETLIQLEEELTTEFGEFGIDIDGNIGVLEKC